jgi:hypothetical protein
MYVSGLAVAAAIRSVGSESARDSGIGTSATMIAEIISIAESVPITARLIRLLPIFFIFFL